MYHFVPSKLMESLNALRESPGVHVPWVRAPQGITEGKGWGGLVPVWGDGDNLGALGWVAGAAGSHLSWGLPHSWALGTSWALVVGRGRAGLWGPGLILCGSDALGYCPPALAIFAGIACTLRCLRESRPYCTGTWG